MKKLSRKFWIWLCVVLAALIGLIVSLVKGWNVAAIVLAVALAIAGLFAAREWKASDNIIRCENITADTVRNVIQINFGGDK